MDFRIFPTEWRAGLSNKVVLEHQPDMHMGVSQSHYGIQNLPKKK